MKAIIYAGIGLFSVASVYGLVDYYQTKKNGKMDKLYKEEVSTEVANENSAAVIPIQNTEFKITAGTKGANNTMAIKSLKKIKQSKRMIRLEDFSRGKISVPREPEIPNEPVIKETIKITEPEPAIKSTPVVKKETERRLSLELFSRAPLRAPVKIEKLTARVKPN